MVVLTLSQEHGFLLSVLLLSIFQIVGMSLRAGRARRIAGVPHPFMYADKAEADADHDKHIFNCVQRAHQNTLEMYPTFAVLLLTGGIMHPCINAGAGLLYLVARELYFRGYSSGSPNKRFPGFVVANVGEIVMLGTTVHTIFQLFADSS